jgi:hypothetical protein
MKTVHLTLISSLIVLTSAQLPAEESSYLSQAAPAATVDFSLTANQQSLRDPAKTDMFTITLSDRQVMTDFTVTCQAGKSAWGGLVRKDEACEVKGKGSVLNPSTGAKLPRTQYMGGYTVQAKQDGYTDLSTIKVNYLALGKTQPSTATFGGAAVMLPESPAPSATQLRDRLMRRLSTTATGGEGVTVNSAIDSVRLENGTTPSAGLPSDKGCSWNGDMIYAYATESWIMDLTARCGEKTFALQGNMAWIDVENERDHNAKYVLTLTLPSDTASSDADLFMTASGDDELFAGANGITGTIKMQQSDKVKIEIEPGVMDDVATQMKATATFTGTGVPIELVRSFGTLVSVFVRTFFGA